MRLLGLSLVLCSACDPARGDWVGRCEWPAGDTVHEESLRLDLDGADSEGLGSGTGRTVAEGDPRRGEVLYELTDLKFSLDLYLPQNDLVLLRGEHDENGVARGVCGSPKVEEFQLDALFDCVLALDPGCDSAPRWEPDGVELAPVERQELKGEFVLRRE